MSLPQNLIDELKRHGYVAFPESRVRIVDVECTLSRLELELYQHPDNIYEYVKHTVLAAVTNKIQKELIQNYYKYIKTNTTTDGIKHSLSMMVVLPREPK